MTQKRVENCALVFLPLFYEVDMVLTGKGRITAHFIHALNALLECFVLKDAMLLDPNFSAVANSLLSYPENRHLYPLMSEARQCGALRYIDETEMGSASLSEAYGGYIASLFLHHIDWGYKPLLSFDWPGYYQFDMLGISNILDKKDWFERIYVTGFLDGKGNPIVKADAKLVKIYQSLSRHLDVDLVMPLMAYPLLVSDMKVLARPELVYHALKSKHRELVRDFLGEGGFSISYMPALVLLMLQKCKTREDVPPAMVALREEFEPIRLNIRDFERNMLQAKNFGAQVELLAGYKEAERVLCRKMRSLDSRLLHMGWQATTEVSPNEISKKTIGGIIAAAEDWVRLTKISGLHDLLNSIKRLPKVLDQVKLIEAVFKEVPSDDELKGYCSFSEGMNHFIFRK